MATRTCPNCSTQYVATVRRCIDCDAMLVDDLAETSAAEEVRAEPIEDREAGDTVRLTLAGWGNQLKVTLEGMLQRQGIPRAWEAGVLVIPAAVRDEVAELIEALEGRDLPELDDSVEQVALDIEGLDPDARDDLDGRLLAASIAHAWTDDGDLLVAADDEEAVLDLVAAVFADAEAAEEQGVDASMALTELFVAADRLIKRIGDRRAETAYADAVVAVTGIDVPYGLDGLTWRLLLDRALALRSAEATPAEGDSTPAEGDGADAGTEAGAGVDGAEGAAADDGARDGDAPEAGDGEAAEADAGDDAGAGSGAAMPDAERRAGLVRLRDELRDLV